MKKAVCITVAAVLCALVFCMTGVGCAKETEQVNVMVVATKTDHPFFEDVVSFFIIIK